jgi:hypothetical protein
MARDFAPSRQLKIAGILCVFQDFQLDELGKKIRHPAKKLVAM